MLLFEEDSRDESLFEAGNRLVRAAYKFAKTMPDNPHWYTVRDSWDDEEAFVSTAITCQTYGTKTFWWGQPYMQLPLNGYFFWTTGGEPGKERYPVLEETIINRKRQTYATPYDELAASYDEIRDLSDEEINDVRAFLKGRVTEEATILDVGCGTGLFLEMFPVLPAQYFGIDKSAEMLRLLAAKHAEFVSRTLVCALEDFYPPKRYDLVVALFGSGQSITQKGLMKIQRLTAPGGRWCVMTYFSAGGMPQEEYKISVPLGKAETYMRQMIDVEPLAVGNHHRLFTGIMPGG